MNLKNEIITHVVFLLLTTSLSVVALGQDGEDCKYFKLILKNREIIHHFNLDITRKNDLILIDTTATISKCNDVGYFGNRKFEFSHDWPEGISTSKNSSVKGDDIIVQHAWIKGKKRFHLWQPMTNVSMLVEGKNNWWGKRKLIILIKGVY